MKCLTLPMLGPESCKCTALGHPKPLLSFPCSGEVRVASSSLSGFPFHHLSGKSEESRGENRISYCWVLLLILHTLPVNIVNAVHATQDRLNTQLI